MKIKSVFAGIVSGILVCLGLLTSVLWLFIAAVRIIAGIAGKIR